jgi:putative phage-type endonuclease
MITQGSDEWFQTRLGKATASRIKDVIAKTKSGPAATRANYLTELVIERITGVKEEGFTNGFMAWGTDQEPEARRRYESEKGILVQEIGFVDHPTIPMSGASPDGLVGSEGILEIKCPSTKTHIETLLADKIPPQYVAQVQWQMACTQRAWCDFVSFDPRMPESAQFFCVRVNADPDYIKTLEEEVVKFLSEVEETINQLNRKLKCTV